MARIHDVTVPLVPGLLAYPGDPPLLDRAASSRLGEAPYGLVAGWSSPPTRGPTSTRRPTSWPGGARSTQLPLEILMGKARVVELLARERVERADLEAARPARRPARAAEDAHVGPAAEGGLPGGPRLPDRRTPPHYLVAGRASSSWASTTSRSTASAPPTSRPTTRCSAPGSIVVEGLDLSEVEPGEYDMACLPLRVGGGDGAPARVVLRSRALTGARRRPHERPAPPGRGRDPARRRRRRAALPAHPRARQAGRALRRAVPDHRLHALELHQLGPAQDLHRHAVQGAEPEPPRAHGLERGQPRARRVHRDPAAPEARWGSTGTSARPTRSGRTSTRSSASARAG